MAIYHCSVKIIGRSEGRSSVAAAAYRSGEKMTNDYDGIEHDYTKKNWIEHTEILLPKQAPREYADRATLWNAVEKVEKSSDAQLAREFELALPIEFDKEQQIKAVRQFASDYLVKEGMCVDIAIHNPPCTNDRHQPVDKNGKVTKDIAKMQFNNPHAHILATVRPIDEKGKWEKKSEIEYVCRKGDTEKALTAKEFKEAKEEGWEKQYRYVDGRKKVWLTADEAARRNLERVNRSPKTSPYGRKNQTVKYWNSKERVPEWRKQWEETVNAQFAEIGSIIRIDSRSLQDQGKTDEIASVHLGPAATVMEKKAARQTQEGKNPFFIVRSDLGVLNDEIKSYNRVVREIKTRWEAMNRKVKAWALQIGGRLEHLRADIIRDIYEYSYFRKEKNTLEIELHQELDRLQRVKTESERTNESNNISSSKINNLKEELSQCGPFQRKKKMDIQKKIQEESQKISQRQNYMKMVLSQCGFQSLAEYECAREKYVEQVNLYQSMNEKTAQIKQNAQDMVKEYIAISTKNEIDIKQYPEISEARAKERKQEESLIEKELQEKYRKNYNKNALTIAKRSVDRMDEEKSKRRNLKIRMN